jgi:hypothetical protein
MSRYPLFEKELLDFLDGYSSNLSWENESYKLIVFKSEKTVEITWPYPINEVYFDFFENENKIFTEWVEFYADESLSEQCKHISYIAKRYLDLPCRIDTSGKLL